MTIRVADFIAQELQRHGVGTVFLLSGGGMMHLVDAVGRANMPYICCHHEQASGMAAEGYARQSGKIGVCYATSGPGATNILTALVGGWQDSSPMLFLTGQSKRSQAIRLAAVPGLRQFGTFEVDIVPVVESVTKYAHFLDDPKSVRYHLEKAIYLATTGRPGPVLLDIPLDVQGAPIDPAQLEGFTPTDSLSGPAPRIVADILERIAQTSRPVLLVGHGVRCAGSVPKLRTLVEKLGVPVVTTQLGKDSVPYDHPQFVGHCGPKGDRPGNFALQSADLILSIGCSLHAQTVGYEVDLFAPEAFKIQVDIERPILQRGDVPVDMQVEAGVSDFIDSLLAGNIQRSPRVMWQERCQRWKKRFAVNAEPHKVDSPEINFYEFADALSNSLAGEETIVTDAGSAFYVMGQAFKCRENQRYIVSGAMGAMGYALPAAIGVSVAAPRRTVICVTGDGSLQTNIHALQTLSHYAFNVKLFVINNDGYASIRNTQKGFFNGEYVGASRESGVSIPPLDKISETFGLPYLAINSRGSMRTLIAEALRSSGPTVIGVRAQSDQAIIPTVSSVQLPNGRMRSNPLHLMSPELPAEVLAQELSDITPSISAQKSVA